jgi:carboxyl-terminal processing protease
MIAGVGVWIEPGYDGALVISSVAGSPADQAGLAPGDLILSADDTPLAGAAQDEVMKSLDGAPGTAVVLVVLRAGSGPPEPIEVVRDVFEVPAVEVDRLAGEIAYLRLASFGPGVAEQLGKALRDIAGQAPSALIVDLRDNPGGDLEGLRSAASHFVGGVLYYVIDGAGRQPVAAEDTVSQVPLPPVFVVVNGGTASAAELLAAILRERLDARVVGEPTFGKATIQGVLPLADGSYLKLTVGEWETAAGHSVADGGLVPDRVLAETEDALDVASAMAIQRAAANG